MSIWSMVLREISYRKLNFLLGLAGISVAVASVFWRVRSGSAF